MEQLYCYLQPLYIIAAYTSLAFSTGWLLSPGVELLPFKQILQRIMERLFNIFIAFAERDPGTWQGRHWGGFYVDLLDVERVAGKGEFSLSQWGCKEDFSFIYWAYFLKKTISSLVMTSRSVLVLGPWGATSHIAWIQRGRDNCVIRGTNMTPLKQDCQPKLNQSETRCLAANLSHLKERLGCSQTWTFSHFPQVTQSNLHKPY